MARTDGAATSYLWWSHELLFSINLALLIMVLHEGSMGGHSWSWRLLHFYDSYRHPDVDFRYAFDRESQAYAMAFLLQWLLAAATFLSLRLLARFSLTKVVLRTFAGLVALAAYPLMCLCFGDGRILFLEVELAIAIVCLVLFAYQKWPVSAPLNAFLLVLHFAIWTWFPGFPEFACCFLFWPARTWVHGNELRLVYPLLGFCSTLLWAAYFRQSRARDKTRDPSS
jgi:hypothetical protein